MTAAIAIRADEALRSPIREALPEGDERPDVIASLDELGPDGDAEVIAVVDGRGPEPLAQAIAGDPRVVAAVSADDGARGAARAAARAAAGTRFGIDAFVPDGTELFELRVASYDDKLRCIDAIDRFASERELRGKYREAIVQCTDELLMNALYAAPREAASEDEELSAAEIAARARRGVRVTWAQHENLWCVSALDGYGSLDRDRLLRALAGAARAGEGAGLGMQLMAGSTSRIWFVRAEGVATECTCVFDTGASRMQLVELGLLEAQDEAEIEAVREALDRVELVPAADAGGAPARWWQLRSCRSRRSA